MSYYLNYYQDFISKCNCHCCIFDKDPSNMPPPTLEMTPAINPNRPQTLKQAKKAYRKAGATPRMSEAELRRLARAVELQERADRIKEREIKKKANRKKKAEKMEKERGARRKVGLPEIREAYVGPSQLKLAFPGAHGKAKEDDESSDASGEEMARTDKQGVSESVETPCRISRSHLQPKSPNVIIRPKSPRAALADKPCRTSDHDWLDFVVSNTQIEQELSTPEINSPTIYVAEPVSASHENPSDILALISTQDLESSIKGSPTTLATVAENPVAPSEASTEDFGSDGVYTDEDFQNLTEDLKLKSAFNPKSESENDALSDTKKRKTCTDKAPLTEADSFELSSQELLALVRNDDFDEFDISTQDLQDLVP